MFNLVNVMRLVAVQQLLQQQQGTLSGLQSQVARLDEQLSSGQDNYNLIFRGPVTGIAIGDRAAARVESDLRPLFEQILAQINRLAAPDRPAPYSEEDRAAYLEAVIQECDTIQLPYAEEGGPATLPLRQIYVALKADRSSPVERKASHQLFKSLVEEEAAEGMGMEEAVIYKIARFDPYAARFLIYDPRLREQLLQNKRAEADRSFDLAEILRRHRWLVLLGDPGSGKSTLARWLSLQLAEALRNKRDVVLVPANHVRPDADAQQQEALGPARLPVLVRLADYAALRWPAPGTDARLPLRLYLGRHIENLLQPGRQPRAVYALIHDYLAASRVAFVLDGLDEITDVSQRQAIKSEIEQLIADWIPNQQGHSPLVEGYHQAEAQMADAAEVGGNQIIVTSRIVGYQLNPLHENLPHFIIQPMDDTAVTSFCHNWTAATGIPDQAGALTKAVLEHPNINVREQMARNPLMLTILAQVFRADPQEGLPDRRSELYRRASTAVFGQRQEQWGQLSQSIGGNDLVRALERITASIAFQLHANPEFPASLADRQSVKRWLMAALIAEPALSGPRRPADMAQELLAAASNLSGFFVARGEGVYGFLHRQFQEYFAALHLVARVQDGASNADRWQPFLQRLFDPNWREVILLTIGVWEAESWKDAEAALRTILDAPDPTAGLLPHNILLAARALQEMERPPLAIVERVAAGLIGAYRRDKTDRFAVLQQRVERAFAALPRQVRGNDPVGLALGKALNEPGETYESGRFLRLAAADLLISSKWFTQATAEALAKAWQAHVEPAGTLLSALQKAYDAYPDYFLPRFLPLRQSLTAELWTHVLQWPHWQAVMRALYLAPYGEMEIKAVLRDSPLSEELLSLLRADPADKERLASLLQSNWTSENGVKQRDAGLALAHLGDIVFASELAGRSGKDRPIPRAIFAAAVFARALDRDLDLARALDRIQVKVKELIAVTQGVLQRESLSSDMQGRMEKIAAKAELIQSRLESGASGVMQSWKAAAEVWRREEQDFTTWLRDDRPLLDPQRVLEVVQAAARDYSVAADLLPRLDSASLADLGIDSAGMVQDALGSLLAADEISLLQRHGALLLAEMNIVTAASLPFLLACLDDALDLTRYRAQRALRDCYSQPATKLGREPIEALAGWKDEDQTAPLVGVTYRDWALNDIVHDQAAWLNEWAEDGRSEILEGIHHLGQEWDSFRNLLLAAPPEVQEPLLDSAAWLLRLTAKDKIPAEFARNLVELCRSEVTAVQKAALLAISCWPAPTEAVLAEILSLYAAADSTSRPPEIYMALARLAGHAWGTDVAQTSEELLRKALPDENALAGLIRLFVTGSKDKTGLPDCWQFVRAQHQNTRVLSGVLLAALLQAGADDDFWGEYHEKLVSLIRELVQGDEGQLAALLSVLQDAVAGSEWPPRRIALAAVSACAEVMPDALNLVWQREPLEALLIQGTEDANSFNSRRFGITALSHLRLLSPGILTALLRTSRDVTTVQQDAVSAARRFHRLSPAFIDENALDPLSEALHGESGAAAYVAAQLLASLGSSPAVIEIPDLRQRIARILSEALQHERAGEVVYLLQDSSPWFARQGTRTQVLLDALLQVWGLPE